ncbi:MAG TPA: hypothetical protein IAB86_05510 [Candidatus Aphodovivens avicola]|nr:hypothetical protein [Candidatus Aphodovivens avicola]
MEPFATVEDYEARYGAVEDEKRLALALSDASAFIAAEMARAGAAIDPHDQAQAQALAYVVCLLVNRVERSGMYAGLSNVSQGAGGYTASVSVYNPGGGFRLYAEERRMLGIGGGRVGMTDPYGDGAR